MRDWRDIEDRPGLRNWPDAVTCPGCQRRFTPVGFSRHVCKGPKAASPLTPCRHCGRHLGPQNIARHETACSPLRLAPPEHECHHCGKRFHDARYLQRHLARGHGKARIDDERIAALRGVAEAGGWLVVDHDATSMLVVRSSDPVRVVHARLNGVDVIGRCVTRQRLVGIDEPVILVLELFGVDEVRAILAAS